MSDHYFTNHPDVPSEPRQLSATIAGEKFLFNSDNGVFSKTEVDTGSVALIEAFSPPAIAGGFLDVGCGYGTIGIALAKKNPGRSITMVDVNERALALAEHNARQNQVNDQVAVKKSDGYESIAGSFAAIITNPPIRAGKDVVHRILRESYEFLLPGGELWAVIRKKQGAPSALKTVENIFDNYEVVRRHKGYYIFKAIKVDS